MLKAHSHKMILRKKCHYRLIFMFQFYFSTDFHKTLDLRTFASAMLAILAASAREEAKLFNPSCTSQLEVCTRVSGSIRGDATSVDSIL